MHALLENLGTALLDMLSLNEGKSSFEVPRKITSGLGSLRNRADRGMVSKERWSASGDDTMEADVVRPSVDEA